MKSDEQNRMWKQLELELVRSDGEVARADMAPGDPVYYCEDAYPDEMVREWADGRKELVRVSFEGKVVRARPYPKDTA
ncbi:hypothetical protein [Noviherbaspirillum pedocola]|jgi:hypothetical protein|uniref:Uncharacterized protein n=1 Tax=Noviherbaspirillum pedocola TaxID=2801341 RepID=A0A934SYV4_9BURK|nr:hypothetical protein [Noviherbaspirillum pedocola]MBK4737825.1 hypothetical protein [Noviherbaspirillum pedocola]